MRMKSFKQKVLKQKEQPNIYMQKTQGPKPSMSSPNLDQRFKSKTILNKQNYQPNVPLRTQRPLLENSFGAAKLMMRQSVDDLKLQMNKHFHQEISQKQFLNFNKNSHPKFNFLSKSINFDKCNTERANAFAKKHLKTEQEQWRQNQNNFPIIEDCEFIRSQYESSEDSMNEQKLNYAKSYRRQILNPGKNILIHESLNYKQDNPRQIITFGPDEAKHLRKYQFSREQQKQMKNQIVNNIIMNSKAEMMRSLDCDAYGSIKCVNHMNKKAKYRLNAALTQQEQQSFYCSKCAVNLAKQGFDIQQILSFDKQMLMSKPAQGNQLHSSIEVKKQQTQRQEQFTGFQKRLENLKHKISNKLKLFSQKSQQMTKIDKKIDLTISNYDQLIEILKQMKKWEHHKEQKLRKQKSLDINLKKHELSTILDNIKDTAFEINNQKNKLLVLKNKQFSFMFDSYVNKIASYEQYLNNLEQTQLVNEIETFDQNLVNEDIDEEMIIYRIFDEMYKKLTNPKLEALVKSSKKKIFGARSNSTKELNAKDIQSGGSSMFYCQEEEDQTRPPFRILFGDSKAQQVSNHQRNLNMTATSNVNNSINMIGSKNQGTIRYFKEESYRHAALNHH